MKKITLLFLLIFHTSLLVHAQQADALFIDTSGHVGLGTNTPLSTLHVKGDLRIDSNMQVLGNLAGQSLNLATASPDSNALQIQAGNFSVGSNSVFSIDANDIPGGRFMIDTLGNVNIPGNTTIESNAVFSVDASGVSGGRFMIDTAGNVSIPGTTTIGSNSTFSADTISIGDAISISTGATTISGTANLPVNTNLGSLENTDYSVLSFLNSPSQWKIWTSGSNPFPGSGLTAGAFEIYEYPGPDLRFVLYPGGEGGLLPSAVPANEGIQVTIDGQGNFFVNGSVHPSYSNASLATPNFYSEEYPLMPLADLEKFIQKEKHLPGILPIQQWNEQRLSLDELQVKTVEKLQELTLYLLELKEENQELRQRVELLESRKE